MTFEKQIQEWLKGGIITEAQAQKMLGDVQRTNKEDSSNKFIVTISTIGSLLLGIGAILFVASNWDEIPDLMKVCLLVGSTLGMYYLGYLFKYDKKNLPKVGASLLFLGSLLFGASIFLIAQIYNINANSHSLLLVWLIGISPLVYAFLSVPIAVLSVLLFLVWTGFFIFRDNRFNEDILLLFPVIYISIGGLLLSLGSLHYFKKELGDIGNIWKMSGMKVALFSLFLLTFNTFSGGDTSSYIFGSRSDMGDISSQFVGGIVLFSIISLIGLAVNLFFNPSQSKTNTVENSISCGIIGFTLLFFFFPSESSIYTVLYNLLFAGITLVLIFIGYQKSDIKLVNMGIFWLGVFLFAKYFDFFWNLMDRSIFFIVGGIILIFGSIALEKKRRNIKDNFIHLNT